MLKKNEQRFFFKWLPREIFWSPKALKVASEQTTRVLEQCPLDRQFQSGDVGITFGESQI